MCLDIQNKKIFIQYLLLLVTDQKVTLLEDLEYNSNRLLYLSLIDKKMLKMESAFNIDIFFETVNT
jgi:hypothetical protein